MPKLFTVAVEQLLIGVGQPPKLSTLTTGAKNWLDSLSGLSTFYQQALRSRALIIDRLFGGFKQIKWVGLYSFSQVLTNNPNLIKG